MTPADLRAQLSITNVKALYDVVGHTESNDRDPYTLVNLAAPDDPARGVKDHHFSSFADHPYAGLKTTQGGYAAGRPQFIPSTWAGLVRQYAFLDFSPPNQDAGFVALLIGRGALDDIIAGRFEQAVIKCRPEWTSLPGASESRGSWTMEKAKAFFILCGGAVAGGPDPHPEIPQQYTPTPLPKPQGEPMLPALIPIIFQALASSLPVVSQIFGARGEVSDRNMKLAQVALDTVVKTTGAVNEQEAVERVKADAAVAAQVNAALAAQPDIAAYLDHVKPMIDQIAAAEQANWRANDDSADRASARWASAKHDIAIPLVNQSNYLFIACLLGVSVLVGLQVWMNEGTVDSGTYALLSVLVYGVVRMADRPSAHRFGGAYDSAAVNAGSTVINQTIQERRKP